jgi:hypothetical protein
MLLAEGILTISLFQDAFQVPKIIDNQSTLDWKIKKIHAVTLLAGFREDNGPDQH